jgi:hypothetical protein
MGTGSCPGVKRLMSVVDQPSHPAPTLKKEYSYTSTPLCDILAYSRGETYFTLLFIAMKYSYSAYIYIYIYIYIYMYMYIKCN